MIRNATIAGSCLEAIGSATALGIVQPETGLSYISLTFPWGLSAHGRDAMAVDTA